MIPAAPEPTYRCGVCRDQGLQATTAGQVNVGHDGRTTMVEATAERPVYRKCRGPMATGCPYDLWRRTQSGIEATAPRSRAVL